MDDLNTLKSKLTQIIEMINLLNFDLLSKFSLPDWWVFYSIFVVFAKFICLLRPSVQNKYNNLLINLEILNKNITSNKLFNQLAIHPVASVNANFDHILQILLKSKDLNLSFKEFVLTEEQVNELFDQNLHLINSSVSILDRFKNDFEENQRNLLIELSDSDAGYYDKAYDVQALANFMSPGS